MVPSRYSRYRIHSWGWKGDQVWMVIKVVVFSLLWGVNLQKKGQSLSGIWHIGQSLSIKTVGRYNPRPNGHDVDYEYKCKRLKVQSTKFVFSLTIYASHFKMKRRPSTIKWKVTGSMMLMSSIRRPHSSYQHDNHSQILTFSSRPFYWHFSAPTTSCNRCNPNILNRLAAENWCRLNLSCLR